MWVDVVFHYQNMPYSQSAGVLHDTWPIGSLPFLPPPLQKLFATVKNTPKLYTPNNVYITSWPIIGAAHCLFKQLTIFLVITNILVLLTLFHQYIGGNMLVSPIGKELQTDSTNYHISRIFFMLAAPIYWWEMVSSTNVLVHYKGNLNVSSTLPIQQAIAYLMSCSKRKRK